MRRAEPRAVVCMWAMLSDRLRYRLVAQAQDPGLDHPVTTWLSIVGPEGFVCQDFNLKYESQENYQWAYASSAASAKHRCNSACQSDITLWARRAPERLSRRRRAGWAGNSMNARVLHVWYIYRMKALDLSGSTCPNLTKVW